MQRYPASPETVYRKGVISLDNVYLGYPLDNRVIIGRAPHSLIFSEHS